MDLLRADELVAEPGERIFRHSALGPALLFLVLLAPIGVALLAREQLLEAARALPWLAWLVIAPLALLAVLVHGLVLTAMAQATRRAFLASNWLLRVSPTALVLNLRSYQNAHFPSDGPTVVRLRWSEIARVREVRDVTRPGPRSSGRRTTRWLQIELATLDPARSPAGTSALERIVTAERERKGPESKRLGVTSRARFGHVPVFVAGPGILRTDWLGRGMLRALGAHTTTAERLDFDLAHASDGQARIQALIERGDRLAASELARTELGLSLVDARAHVQASARKVA